MLEHKYSLFWMDVKKEVGSCRGCWQPPWDVRGVQTGMKPTLRMVEQTNKKQGFGHKVSSWVKPLLKSTLLPDFHHELINPLYSLKQLSQVSCYFKKDL